MLEYVKVCPKCGLENSEFSDICSNDGEFLGMIEPVPKTKTSEAHPLPSEEPQTQTPSDEGRDTNDGCSEKTRATNRFEASPAFYLEAPSTKQLYTIMNGFVLGQQHETSDADIQLSGIPGLNFVHRRHCSFDYADSKWHITAIKQDGFTNPTLVNHIRLKPGQRYPLNNGDKLTLSGVTLNARIV